MDDQLFDRVARLIGSAGSRRDALRALLGAGLLGMAAAGADASKGKNHRKGARKQEQPKQEKRRPKKKPCRKERPNRCGRACTNIKNDEKNCGACGNRCPDGESCVNGNCSCGAGRIECDGACVTGNCCEGGSVASCTGDEQCCPGRGCKGLHSDPENCGACGAGCFAGETCDGGLCLCGEGKIVCGGACVAGSCCLGSVGDSCGDDETCCSPDGCKNLSNDAENCGTCGVACDSRTSDGCNNGVCQCKDEPACPENSLCTSGECICTSIGLPGGCGPCRVSCRDGTTCNVELGRCTCRENEVVIAGNCVACEPPPGGGAARACDGESCSCDGRCCDQPGHCFISYDGSGQPTGEFCCEGSNRFVCEDANGGAQCCDSADCTNGCKRQTARGGSYRRPGR